MSDINAIPNNKLAERLFVSALVLTSYGNINKKFLT